MNPRTVEGEEREHTFILDSPQTLAVQARREPFDEEERHLRWFLTVEKAESDSTDLPHYVAFATLHSTFEWGRCDVHVAGTLVDVRGLVKDDDLRESVANSSALSALWEYARTTALSILGTIDVEGSISIMSPPAEHGDEETEETADQPDGDASGLDSEPPTD